MSVEVSIIIPAYNAEKYIEKTVDMILSQSYKNFEVIVVDDGSKDNTIEILKKIEDPFNRVRIFQQSNKGPSAARNLGIEKARGEYIQFVDADDVIEQDMLLKMQDTSSGCDMVVCGAYFEYIQEHRTFNSDFESNIVLNDKSEISTFISGLEGNKQSLFLNYLWNKWFKRSVIFENYIFMNEAVKLGEDFLFICQFLKKCTSVAITQQSLYHYMIRNNGSLVTRFDRNELARRKIMYEARCDLFRYLGIYQDCKEKLKISEGFYAWDSLKKVFSPNCKLEYKDKIKYIREFLNDSEQETILAFLKNSKRKSKYLCYLCVKLKMSRMVYFIRKEIY